MATTQLSTTRFIPPGAYIGQIITPSPVSTSEDSLLPCYVAKGSRYAVGRNLGIRRSFIYEKALTFSSIAPYQAPIVYASDGDNEDAAVKLYKSDGSEVRKDQWRFVASGGSYSLVEINVEVFDTTASYIIDYQSTSRLVKDPLPVEELRSITTLGDNFDTSQYVEYTHYYIDVSMTGPTAVSGTPHTASIALSDTKYVAPSATSPAPTGTVTGTMSTYTGVYNRLYSVEVINTSAAGMLIEWSTPYAETGYGAPPAIPFDSGDTRQIMVPYGGIGTTSVTFELGIGVDITHRGTPDLSFTTGDKYLFGVSGLPLFEKDVRFNNTNQFPEIGAVVAVSAPAGTATISVNVESEYTGNNNRTYSFYCYHVSGDHASIAWHGVDQELAVSGRLVLNHSGVSVTALTGITLNAGIYLDITTGTGAWFATGDSYTLTAKAPQIFYRGKDDRTTTFAVTVATATGTNSYLTGYLSANTPEGGYSTFNVVVSASSVDYDDKNGKYVFGDNLITYFKNSYCPWFVTVDTVSSPSNVFTGGMPPFGDNWTMAFDNLDTINWSLNAKNSQNFNAVDLFTDVYGTITGIPNTKYIILDNSPLSIFGIENVSGTAFISGTDFTLLSGTSYVYFSSAATTTAKLASVPITVNYLYNSAEPNPGDLYYLTALYLRPHTGTDSLYDTPILLTSQQTARDLLAPATLANDIYVMSEVAWDNNVGAFYIIQVNDIDGDGTYTELDYQRAIDVSEGPTRIADIEVINKWKTLPYLLNHVNRMADPFARRHRMTFLGMPTGTEIGNKDTSGTLVYTAARTLQVYGESPSHGTRVLVGHTYAKRNITLENNVEAEVEMDGSFISGAIAAKVRGFALPTTTLMRKQLGGFTYIETFGDIESYENKQLGKNNMVYITDTGSGVYQIEDETTVDTYAEDFYSIMNMTEKQYVTRYIEHSMDKTLIAMVVPYPEAALTVVKGELSRLLDDMVSDNIIAPYLTDAGLPRDIDTSTDLRVYADSNSKNLIRFLYCYFLPGTIKRLYGMYTVDRTLTSLGLA